MNKYINAFCRYSFLIDNIEKQSENKYKFDNDLKALEKNLKAFLNTDDDTDNSGSVSISFDFAPSFFYKNNENIIALLVSLSKNSTKKQKTKLLNLVSEIKKQIEKLNKANQEVLKSIKRTKNFAQNTTITNYHIQRKFENYKLFALNKALNIHYFPTSKVVVNTDEFKNLSRQELVSLFNKENFYKLSNDQIVALMQAVVNEYLQSNKVSSCSVNLADLTFDEDFITYGEYNPNLGCININKNLINLIDNARKFDDQCLPYQILTTLIHEATHRVQFASLDKEFKTEFDKAISSALLKPNATSYSEYLSSLDELDARNSTLLYLKQNAISCDALAQFYNNKKREEINSPKQEISNDLKYLFKDIYDYTYLPTEKNKFLNEESYYKTINSHFENVEFEQ